MKKFVYSATKHKVIKCSRDKDFSIEDVYDYAADYVNDHDRDWEYDTPKKFGRAIVNFIEREYGVELNPEEVDYVMKQASRGDFSAFED